jgi:sec-independent protein translocase protein TatA
MLDTFMFAFIGMWETVAILAVVVLLFGAKKMPELAKGLGQGMKEFRKATRDSEEQTHESPEDLK